MDSLDLVIIILIISILFVLYTNKEYLYPSTINNNKDVIAIENIKTGTRTYDDKLFDDVIMYESDPADINKSGVYKCLENCKGNCVEYGITGNTFCFPRS